MQGVLEGGRGMPMWDLWCQGTQGRVAEISALGQPTMGTDTEGVVPVRADWGRIERGQGTSEPGSAAPGGTGGAEHGDQPGNGRWRWEH